MKTFTHFFGSPAKRFARLPDPRQPEDPGDVEYSVASLVFLGLLMFSCRLGARRQVRLKLFTTFLAGLFKVLFDVDRVPHGDTMNGVLCGLPLEDGQELVTGMTETLIDKKVLYPHRLFERYYVVAVDATGMLSYDYPHCPHCLRQTQGEKTRYYHPVLEAKLVTPSGFAFSLMSEFIENPDQDPAKSDPQRKQDCELKAFYRLAQRLHARYPRLRLLLAMDGLYARSPTQLRTLPRRICSALRSIHPDPLRLLIAPRRGVVNGCRLALHVPHHPALGTKAHPLPVDAPPSGSNARNWA